MSCVQRTGWLQPRPRRRTLTASTHAGRRDSTSICVRGAAGKGPAGETAPQEKYGGTAAAGWACAESEVVRTIEVAWNPTVATPFGRSTLTLETPLAPFSAVVTVEAHPSHIMPCTLTSTSNSSLPPAVETPGINRKR